MSGSAAISIGDASFPSIRAALNAAVSGSVIALGPGKFNITKSDGDPSLPEAGGSSRPTLALSPASNLTIRGAGARNTTIIGNGRIYALGRDGGPPPNGLSVEELRFLYDSTAEGYIFSPSRGSLPYDPASPTIAGVSVKNVSFEGEHRGANGVSGTYMDITGSRDITLSGIRVSLKGQSGYDPITGTGGGFFLFNEGGRNLRVLNSEFDESGYSSSLISLFNPDSLVDGNKFKGAGLIKQDDGNDPANNPRGERFYNAGGSFINNSLAAGAFFDYLFIAADQGVTWQDYKAKNASADGTYGLRTKVEGNSFNSLSSGYGVLIRSDSSAATVQRMLSIANNSFSNGLAVRSELTSPSQLVFGSNTVNGIRFDSLYVGGNGNDRLNESRDNGKSKWISGGPGNDDLYGSADARDAFVFWAPLNLVSNVDTIQGFSSGGAMPDKIWLSAIIFASLALPNGVLDPSSFTANSTGSARGGTAQIIYNTAYGDLFYDFDGTGGGQAVLFARLPGKPALSSSNFLVFGTGQADLFDEASYLASHGDLITAFGYDLQAAARHYSEYGYREGRSIDLFNENRYLASYGDLITAFGYDPQAATKHYIEYGYKEGRLPDVFDEVSYLASYGDLITAFGNNPEAATKHYIEYGYKEGRLPDVFDEFSYLASYGDLITAFGNNSQAATKHYTEHGYKEGRLPDVFDELNYLASYGDLISAIGNNPEAATKHYIEYGFKEGRQTDLFNPAFYVSQYPDLLAAFGNDYTAATQHYITYGFFEGRVGIPTA